MKKTIISTACFVPNHFQTKEKIGYHNGNECRFTSIFDIKSTVAFDPLVQAGRKTELYSTSPSMISMSSERLLALVSESDFVSSASPSSTFDPVVDVSAASAFSLIAVVFSLLIARASAVDKATTRRKVAMDELRTARTQELTGAANPDLAVKELEEALKEEERLRTIIPGIRIRAPDSLQGKDKDQVRQLLKTADSANEYDETSSILSSSKNFEPEPGSMSNGSKVVLGAIMISQILLLFILSFDPMQASNVFDSVGGGEPPSDLPFSSW